MATKKHPLREPTHDWEQLRPLMQQPEQLTYEILRPEILFGQSPTERATETGMSRSTICYKANLFDQAGMASLFPPEKPPAVPKLDNPRTLPPPMRQAIVDWQAECPTLGLRELATLCYVRFGRRPSPNSVKLVLAAGPAPTSTTRRYPPYAQLPDPVQRRLAVIHLHVEGWKVSRIAQYLETSRQSVYATLKRWAEATFAGLRTNHERPRHLRRKRR